ncbi:hypothetical protein KSS94_10145 [Pseudomonas fakonensis]|uniref:Lipoprotein n=1 Tax=Pseudomonas fakonensis TaxID=2842355 RepID=A0ABX8NDH8_9PSED|nr:hypothetical protein [Pseudomonas fakonensis]QXH53442.1 hypothetical protein KSS94_10145 [Pseudomonas fakonensis]
MKAIVTSVVMLAVSGCSTAVDVQFREPAKGGDFKGVESLAKEHFEYIAIPNTYVLIRPVAQAADAPAAGKATLETKQVAKKDSAGTAADSTQKVDAKENARTTATALIDGKQWEAVVVQLPDDQRYLAVRGVTGFWKTSTVGLAKAENSDRVVSLNSKAENLVPKRLEQGAAIVGAIIKAPAGVAATPKLPLRSFAFKVPASGPLDSTPATDWQYRFAYDSAGLPAGTVSYEDFRRNAVDKTVSYWPVPACRSATLELRRNSELEAVFHLTVSSADVLRLQPLPVDGQVNLGSVCGSSVSGTVSGDPVAAVSDNLKALQQAIKTVRDAKAERDKAGDAAKAQ